MHRGALQHPASAPPNPVHARLQSVAQATTKIEIEASHPLPLAPPHDAHVSSGW